jgi:large subunit ribosomal protein L32
MKSVMGVLRNTEHILQNMINPPRLSFQLAPSGWALPSDMIEEKKNDDDLLNGEGKLGGGFGDIFEQSVWNMAVPKSKVSPSRKRQKHKQHIPEAIGWSRCIKCGEPKRPHRICTKNIEVCAMKPAEYEAYLNSGSVTTTSTVSSNENSST